MRKFRRRPANALCCKIDSYFDAVGDFDKGNTAIDSVVLAIKSHGALDLAGARPIAGNDQRQLLLFRYSAYREVAINFKVNRLARHPWTGLNYFRRMERDQRIILDVKEVFALQLAILHS